MKARVKETNEIIEVNSLYPVIYSRLDCNRKIIEEYDEDELDFNIDNDNSLNKNKGGLSMPIFDTEKYFNAKEAFSRTCKIKNEIMNNSLENIYNYINTSIELGKTSVTIYEDYDDDVINFLKSLNYNVEKINDPKDGDHFILSWDLTI